MKFLPVKTSPNAAIATCGRCRKKMYLSDLRSDPNIPGLRVCRECSDVFDPYRKAPRQPDDIILKNPRLDESLALEGYSIPAPTLEFNFLSETLDDRITFTRNSIASYYDSNGDIQSVAIDVPRYDSGAGVLIEPTRTNSLTYSNNYSNAAWTKSSTTATVSTIVAPDGSLMYHIKENSANSTHTLSRSITTIAGQTYTISFFVKSDGSNRYVRIQPGGISHFSANNHFASFNINEGTYFTSGVGAINYSIVDHGDGVYRISVTAIATTSTTAIGSVLFLITPPSTATYTGDGVSGVYVGNAQLEVGYGATSYINTTSSAMTRYADEMYVSGANFSDWFNPLEGTFLLEYELGGSDAYHVVLDISDGTTSNRVTTLVNAIPTLLYEQVVIGGTNTVNLYDSTLPRPSTDISKLAFTYKEQQFSASLDGAELVHRNVAGVPTVNRIDIGRLSDASQHINGHIRSIKYWDEVLPNDDLLQLSE